MRHTFRNSHLHEWQNVLNHVILAAICEEHETDAGRLARVPVVVVVKFLLLGQRLHQEGHDVLEGA